MPLLIPGVGAQGGDVAAVVENGLAADGAGLLVSSSRAILYASGGDDYAEAAATAAKSLRDERSAERRVGTECVRPCRSRWAPYHSKKNHNRRSQYHKLKINTDRS